MPTFQRLLRFDRDWEKLSEEEKNRFRAVAFSFISDLKNGQRFRRGLRLKRVKGTKHPIWEITWAPDGRATWEYGEEVRPGEPHIVWRRIGTHDIFPEP